MYGWVGVVLRVDLTHGKIEKEALPNEFAEKYLGGIGFNTAKLFNLQQREQDTFSPENVIMFGTGPLAGTLYPGSARLTVTAKSPLSDAFGSTNLGGLFAAEMKYAGYDQIICFGRAEKPVYLWIDDHKVELRDASHLWGTSTWETGMTIRREIGDPELQVLCIGQAGENLVRYASIINPPRGAGGRSGMGAIMGSKNLKAIAVRGTGFVKVARPDEFLHICQESTILGRSEPRYNALRGGGSAMWLDFAANKGVFPAKNYTRSFFPKWSAVSGKRLQPGGEFTVRKRGCFACPVNCSGFFNIKAGEFEHTLGRVPEYGMTVVGVKCDIDNLESILKMQDLCDRYGIDSMSGGYMLSWAMDCYARGILTKEDCEGIPLEWGNYNAVLTLIPKIAERQGYLGDLLAEGEKRAPRKLGRGSEKFMYHIKGLSVPGTDPRADKVFGFSYYTAPRGADHLSANTIWVPGLLRETDLGKELVDKYAKWEAVPSKNTTRSLEGLGETLSLCEDITAVINASGICTRTGGSFELITKALSAATGVDFNQAQLIKTGERIFNIEKAFNSREGLTRTDDNVSIPDKFTKEPLAEGSYEGDVLNLEPVLDEYYRARGWDVGTGLQTRAKLEELDLEFVVTELAKVNAVK